MKRIVSEEYKKELAENHDIHGTPRIRADWNWNNTSFFAERARRGSKIEVYDASGLAHITNRTQFELAFDSANHRKTLNHYTVNFTGDISTPNVNWTAEAKHRFIPILESYFGVEQNFYIDVREAGLWRFGVDSDDAHQLWIYDINEANPVLLTSYYGSRGMLNDEKYTEFANHTFPTVGRYKVRMLLTNNGTYRWGIRLGIQTPSQTSIKAIPNDLTIAIDHGHAPLENPEVIPKTFGPTEKGWDTWRDYFPVGSLADPVRPLSGIRYNNLNDDAYLVEPDSFLTTPQNPYPKRYYLLNKKEDMQYRFWKSDEMSAANGTLDNATVRVSYTDWVQTNKITFVANLGPKPEKMTIRYLTKDALGVESWVNIIDQNDWPDINPWTGELTYYIDENSDWVQMPVGQEVDGWFAQREDNCILVKAIEFTIHSLDRHDSRAEVIQFYAGKQLDITHRTIDFSIRRSMDEPDWMRIIGKVSSNDGSIQISNWDNAFQLDYSPGVTEKQRLKQITERLTEFTFDLVYDLSEQGVVGGEAVRMATMHSAGWNRDGEYDYTVEMFDSAKKLQNLECPEIYETDIPMHILLGQMLDLVGFGRYKFDTEDFAMTSPRIDHFANDPDDTVWKAITALCDSTMSAVYFDEYDDLQLITKEELIHRPAEVDHVLRGQYDPLDPKKLPNFSSFEKDYELQANKATIKWTPRSTKKDKDILTPIEQTDIVWQSNDNITLQSTKLIRSMAHHEDTFFWIRQEDAFKWQWKGKANVNGEIIEWHGKEYKWIDGLTGKIYYDIVHSKEDQDKRDAKSIYGFNRGSTIDGTGGVNGYTGLIKLKHNEKTGEPEGRAIDDSGYRVMHPIGPRPGWQHSTLTLGNAGVWPGFWPGEQHTSFYLMNEPDSKVSAVGINRPTNRNDDWFKTQAIVRQSEKVLQQWGCRVMFKESTTIGELSIFFNMGQSFGNAEAVTTVGGPKTFNQWYQVSFLETQNLVRNHEHEISGFVQTPDPVFRTHDNAIRGSASRMYARGKPTWEDRMKGQEYWFKRNVWYDLKIDLTRGRGYTGNESLHYFVWVNGDPVAGFDAAGPSNRHKFLARTNWWGIGSRAASKLEISNAYSWTEFTDPILESESARYDFTNGGYISSYLEEGILYPAVGKSAPYRDGAQFGGEFFFDDMGSTLHEIREFDITLEKTPVEAVTLLLSNPNVRNLELSYGPNKAKFSIVNISDSDQVAHGEEELKNDVDGENNKINHSMALYGYVLEEGEEQTITKKNEISIRDRGEVELEVESKWINNQDQAEALAKWVVQHFAEPKDVVTVEAFADATYSIGDKVRVIYDKGEIDKDWLYMIRSVDTEYNSEGLIVQLTIVRVRDNALTDEEAFDPAFVIPPPEPIIPAMRRIANISGRHESTWTKGKVAATELLIPFKLQNDSVGFLGGNSYSSAAPGGTDWRSMVGFRSNQEPKIGKINFDSAYQTPGNANGNHLAPQLHPVNLFRTWNVPFPFNSGIRPSDGFSFYRTQRQLISAMYINRWPEGNMAGIPGDFRTNWTGLIWSDDGNNFNRRDELGTDLAFWPNTPSNSSPFAMQSWQDGFDNYMYMISVKAGNQTGPMMLQRVWWEKTFWKSNYQGWRKDRNGRWGWGRPDECHNIFGEQKVFGHPSLRKLPDGSWAMSYLTNTVPKSLGGPKGIVTRTAPHPTGPWSEEKIQLTQGELPGIAEGGFIHPYSDAGELGLTLLVTEKLPGYSGVIQYRGTL